jgi:RimJ/RimL family protein N-acetyltransferase
MAKGRRLMPKGHLVELTALTDADSDTLFRWINDRDLVLMSSAYRPVDEKAHRDWFDSIRRRPDVAIFGIRELATGRLVGSCQLLAIHPVHRKAELQIRIGEPAARGRGLGREAVELLLDFAFQDLNLHRVELTVLSGNEVALKTYAAAGFVREGVLRQAAHVDGGFVDVILMAVLREERRPR